MRTFKIDKDWKGVGCSLCRKGTIELLPGVTVLVGCNGIGKTTLLQQIEHLLKKEGIPVLSFDNLLEGGAHARSEAAFQNDWTFVGTSMCASEGENIHMNLGRFAGKIAGFQKANQGAKELWFLLDAVDSGLSIDNVVDLKGLFELVLEHHGGAEVYIVVSANAYEMARGEKCFDVLRGKYTTIRSYERYRNFVLGTRKAKDNRKYKN